ncbi:unnamed protein product [Adineta steineri]|uniref:Uncharacterized protein n=1 Tax=Adineta steineri TaxID=433720 RepID=A0A815H715_9BILA|nr:unnamed protein product [Adineta steineri]
MKNVALTVGLSKEQPLENHITLAHYISMSQPRTMLGCGFNETVEDTSIRDRFADRTYLETPGRSRHVKLGINLYIDANQKDVKKWMEIVKKFNAGLAHII